MPVPMFEETMLPIMEFFADGKEHTLSEVYESVALKLGVSEEERRLKVPSGEQRIFNNRVQWAVTYLKQARLIRRVRRAVYVITDRGRTLLKSKPKRIDGAVLLQFPEFVQYKGVSRIRVTGAKTAVPAAPEVDEQPPIETIEAAIVRKNQALADELMELVMEMSPDFFEKLVLDLLIALKYGGSRQDAAQRLGQTGDGGVDGVVREDPLGLDVVYVQAKRWQNTVGRPEVQKFVGSLEGYRSQKGVMITTSGFSDEAREFVKTIGKRVVLIDGMTLASLMIEHCVGVEVDETYVVKKVDSDYFEEQ